MIEREIFDIYIIPEQNGHYENYCRLFSRYDENLDSKTIVLSYGLCNLIKLLKEIKSYKHAPRCIHLLLGEKDIFRACVLRIFGYRVSSIFYRVPHKNDTSIKNSMALILLWFANIIGIITITLEPALQSRARFFKGVLFDVTDLYGEPCKKKNRSCVNKKIVLLPGHLTRRKLVLEMIDVFDAVSKLNSVEIQLRLVGKIEETYKPEILALIESIDNNLLEVVLVDERVSDEQLICELNNADLVSALYFDHVGSSGVTINSISLRTPVLFFPVGALSKFADLFPNASFPKASSDVFGSAKCALQYPERYKLPKVAVEEFVRYRSLKSFVHDFHEIIAKNLYD